MSKGLEALENILNQKLVKPDKYRKTIGDIASVGQVAIIQKELEDYEETKEDLKQVMHDYQDLGNSCYKKCKALEIIKNKVGIHWQEVLKLWLKNKLINQEEYDLLKEVLEK